MLNHMQQLCDSHHLQTHPDMYCVGNVLTAWYHHHDHNEAGARVEQLLQRFEESERHVGGDAALFKRQKTIWYNTALSILSKCDLPDAPDLAERILARMDSSLRDLRTYHAVLAAYANSPHVVVRASRAKALLNEMIIEPNLPCYNMALKACACSQQEEASFALETAEEIFGQIQRPNAATYGRMTQAYTRLLQPGRDRDDKLRTIFRQCCTSGQVNFLVLNALQAGASSSNLMADLLGHDVAAKLANRTLSLQELPSEWLENRFTNKDRYYSKPNKQA
jgi:hypothetical protein